MKHTIQEENWEDRFNKRWLRPNWNELSDEDKVLLVKYTNINGDSVKEFIRQEFASQLQSILEEVEGMKKEEPSDCICKQTNDRSLCAWHQLYKNYNQALSDVQSIISNRMGEKI